MPELVRSFYMKLKNTFGKEKQQIRNTVCIDDGRRNVTDQINSTNGKKLSDECSCIKLYLNSRIQFNRTLQKINAPKGENTKQCLVLKEILDKELYSLENM